MWSSHYDVNFNVIVSVDVEEGVGNAHANHTLPNSTHAAESPCKDEAGGDDDEEKSVLQAKLTNLAIQIGYGGMAVSLVTVIILSVKFSVDEFYYEVFIMFFNYNIYENIVSFIVLTMCL